MTPKEKAKELILKFAFKGAQHEGEAKSFALICVDEIIKTYSTKKSILPNENKYWQKVKTEIEKL